MFECVGACVGFVETISGPNTANARTAKKAVQILFFITQDVEFVRFCFNQKIGAGKSDSGRPDERQYAGICSRTSGRVQEDAHIHLELPHVRNLARCAGLRVDHLPGDAGQVFDATE